MLTKKVYLLIFNLLLFSLWALSQRKSIPFHLDQEKRIILEYIIKGEKVKLFLDTGTSDCVLDTKVSDKLNFLSHKKNREITMTTIGNIPYKVILPDGLYKTDSIFSGSWGLTDMSITRKLLNLGDEVDGFVGIDFKINKIVELDFINNQLCFWDSVPQTYLKNFKGIKVALVKSDFGRETKDSYLWSKDSYIKGVLTVADTIKLHPIFLFDTGGPRYSVVVVYDSLLLKKMVAYKKIAYEKFGINYPTTRLQIPELGIDSAYVRLNILPKCFFDKKKIDAVEPNYVVGLLGVDFFLQYEKILFDCKNRFGYFIKKE